MSTKKIIIEDHEQAAQALFQEVGEGNFRVFSVPAFQAVAVLKDIGAGRLQTCTAVGVAISQSWMAVAPYRVDKVPGNPEAREYNIDTMIVALDPNTQQPSPTAILGQHQSHVSRSIALPGHESQSLAITVADRRANLVEVCGSYDNAPEEIKLAMQHMVSKFQKDILGTA